MSLKKTMQFIEENKTTYLFRKNTHKFICDQCLKKKDIDQKAPYVSNGNEDLIFCLQCIDNLHETGEW
ncbi:hypothetical protein Elgi_38840 [Paenibacillus elgii]|nr:hypothetical protein Elgi_38840 [Paenibacillus elgii]